MAAAMCGLTAGPIVQKILVCLVLAGMSDCACEMRAEKRAAVRPRHKEVIEARSPESDLAEGV